LVPLYILYNILYINNMTNISRSFFFSILLISFFSSSCLIYSNKIKKITTTTKKHKNYNILLLLLYKAYVLIERVNNICAETHILI
jgi:hypothetical protein